MAESPAGLVTEDFRWGTHVEVLRALIEQVPIRSVLEFGMGMYSTPMLVERIDKVFAVEQSDPDWVAYVRKLCDGKGELFFEPSSTKALEMFGTDWDMAFVDGKREERLPALQGCLDARIPFIVAHDMNQTDWYQYHRVVKPKGYFFSCFRHSMCEQVTGVFGIVPLALRPKDHIPWRVIGNSSS
jgi:hypothetical protein